MDKPCYVQPHRQIGSPQLVSHLYGYQGLHLAYNVRLQVQKAINDASFLQTHPLLLLRQPNVFQSIMNVRFVDVLCPTRTILPFVLKSPGVLAAESDLNCIQFQYVPKVHCLHHQLLNPRRFLGDHATSPINDGMALCSGFLKNQSNRGIFCPLLFSHQKQPSFLIPLFWQKFLLIRWSRQYFVPIHQLECVAQHLADCLHLDSLHG